MLETINQWDTELFLFLNGLHADWLDPIMRFVTGKREWIPLYLLIVVLIIRQLKWRAIYLLLSFAVLITISDQLASGVFKPFFERLRPCRNEEIADLIHLIKGCGGKYGFASSHASNTFALGTFLFLIYRNKWSALMICWAALVSYSRIYAGVHYPGDILMGAVIGVFAAFVTYLLYKKFFNKDLQKIHSLV